MSIYIVSQSSYSACILIICYFIFWTTSNGSSKANNEPNPFEEEEWDEGDSENILVDNGEPGVPVKALYDYEGAEGDELTFKKG